jgi:hypothetical protein
MTFTVLEKCLSYREETAHSIIEIEKRECLLDFFENDRIYDSFIFIPLFEEKSVRNLSRCRRFMVLDPLKLITDQLFSTLTT